MMFMLLVVAAGAVAPFGQTIGLRPGRYETTTQIDMPAMKMPPEKEVECLTAEDLKNMKTFITSELAQECKVSESKITGTELTFTGSCDAGETTLLMSMKMTFTSESFTGLMTATEKGKPFMTVRSSGKRIGDCVN
jgi:hypothetical protein